MGIGMLGVDNALERIARVCGIFHLARFGVDGRKQTVVVDDAAAQTHLLHDVEQVRLAVLVEDGDEAHGVDGVGIELFHVGVLLDILLEDAEVLLLEVSVELVKALVIGDLDALAAVAALEILHFAEQNGMALAERSDLLLGRLPELDKISADVLAVELVELVLVLEEVGVVVVIHKGVEFFADQAGHIGGTLRLGQVVECKNLIIVVAGAVFAGAVEHIEKDFCLALARTLVHGVDRLFHFAETRV